MKPSLPCAVAGALLFGAPAFAQQAAVISTPAGQWSLGQLYLRGDAGGAFSAGTSFKSVEPFASDSLLEPGARLQGNSGNSGMFDIGFGSRILPYLRWDATLSYLPALKFSGSGASAHMNSWTGLVNGYVDINRLVPYGFGPFEPYVDAGLGAASNTIDRFNSATLAGGTAIAGNTQTSFAYALGAGVGYPIAPNVTLDLAYRYLDLGDVKTGPVDSAGPVTPLKADLREHTVTLGFRYAM